MNVGISNNELLPRQVAEELEMVIARIRAGWNVEHDAEGHHTQVTALGVKVSGLLAVGSDPLQGTQSTFTQSGRFVYLSNSSSESRATSSALIQQLVPTTGSAQAFGGTSRASHSSGVVTLLIGTTGQASVLSSGNVSNARGFQAVVHTEGGSGGITDARGLYVAMLGRLSGTGTITNGYGVYIEHGSSGITNRWGVYQATTAVPNFFSGQVRVGANGTVSGVPVVVSDPSFPGVTFYESGASSNNKYWEHITVSAVHRLDILDDTYSTRVQFFSCTRAGTIPGAFILNDAARGSGANTGRLVVIGRNTSGMSGAPGCVQFVDRSGASWFVWVDTTGDVRVGSSAPTDTSGDTIGTVVGTQT